MKHVRGLVLAAMFASGFAGLAYQVIWTQQCALWLGHETAAVLAVVAAFFGGMALGAWLFGRRIEGTSRPVLAYAVCEAVVGLWGLVLALTMAPLGGLLAALIGTESAPAWQWCISFAGTAVLLLPATMAMGATLPAMERLTRGSWSGERAVATLYASNTLGACAGVLACTAWLLPHLGLRLTALVCAALNLLVAAVTWRVLPEPRALVVATPGVRTDDTGPWILAATGVLGIGYEVLVVRVLSEVCENTVYTYAAMLAVYLAGSAVGAALYRSIIVRRPELARTDRLLYCVALACLAGGSTLWAAEWVHAQTASRLGAGMASALGTESVLAALAFGAPTIVMGALFSHLSTSALRAGRSLGRTLSANTAGAACAPLVVGVLLLPWLHARNTLLLLIGAYVVLAVAGSRAPRRWSAATAGAVTLAILAATLPSLEFVTVPEGGRILSYRVGAAASVSVVQDADGVAVLRIDNRQQEGSSATLRVDGRQAWLPILLHPQPHRALFLGLGTGVTSSAAALDPDLQVDAVELLPEVAAASDYFRDRLRNDLPRRPRVWTADARRFVRASGPRYDVIVADNFHPARSGAGSLYTVEHFAAVRARLSERGVFCQWLPLHQLDLGTLRSIVRTFMSVFPQGTALLASNSLQTPVIGLVARADAGAFDVAALRGRLAARTAQLVAFGIEDEFALLGAFFAGPEALRRFAADAPLNTDDLPVVAFRAPRMTYAPDSTPAQRLLQLLSQMHVSAGDVVGDDEQLPLNRRQLAAYWQARERFLAAGMRVRAYDGTEALLAQVRDPLLDVLRVSPDFRPAYDPLLRMAAALAPGNRGAARTLLQELHSVQPLRPEAGELLAQLAGTQ